MEEEEKANEGFVDNNVAKQSMNHSITLLACLGALAIVGLIVLALFGVTEALILGALIFVGNTAVNSIAALTQVRD